MIIVAGHLIVDASARDAFVDDSAVAVEAARTSAGCLEFSVTADSVDPTRVQIYERWETEEQLLAFRGSGPSGEQQTAIVSADVKRFGISSVGDP
ncbi:antibiotic biosynthesis monooxygenase [soil metagenome]